MYLQQRNHNLQFTAYRGDNVSEEWEKIRGQWMTIEKSSDWFKNNVENVPFQVLVLGWGSEFISWRDLTKEEKRILWFNWITRKQPYQLISYCLRGF